MSDNDPIREYQAEVHKRMDQAELLRPILKAVQEAIQRAEIKTTVVNVREYQSNPRVEVMLIVGQLKESLPLFRELAKKGFHTNKENPYEDDNLFEIFPMRRYDLGPVGVIVVISPPKDENDGKSCRMVQTGVQEVPIYEIQCDE